MRIPYARPLGLLSAAVLVPAFAGLTAPSALGAPGPAARTASAAAPVTFARNAGQAPSGVRYLGASAGVGVAFTDSGVTIDLTRGDRVPKTSVTLRFLHAKQHPEVTGAQRSSAVVNDFRGSDPARWHAAIPTFGQVVYHDLWPGIDGIFSARNGTLKYSFTLAPGADPNDIRLSYAGADRVALDRGGDLAVTAGRTVLHDQAPVSRQSSRPVRTGYRLLGGTTFGFTLGRYARTAPLTLDPGLEYGTYLGAGDGHAASAYSVDHDAAGNLYVFGQTSSPGFPVTQGAYQTDLHAGTDPDQAVDFVVTKLDPTGTRLIYSTFVGGSRIEGLAWGVTGDDGSVYVTGQSYSADFPTTAGAYRRTPFIGGVQGVAFKLGPDGSRLVYGTYLAPDITEVGVRAGADGSLTVAGHTTSDYAPTTEGAYQTDYPGGETTNYIVRLNPAGSDLVFATYLGAPITDQLKFGRVPSCFVIGLAVDEAGATYATGMCANGFPVTPGGFQATKKGVASILIKLDPTGRKVDYATYIGDTDSIVRADAVAVDRDGHAWVASDAPPGSVPPTPDAYASQCVSIYCVALTEFDTSGRVAYSTYFASTQDQTTPLGGVAVDDDGRVYVAGMTGAGLPTTPDAYAQTPGNYDVPFYLAVFENRTLRYATYFGGTSATCIGTFCGAIVGTLNVAPHISSGTVYLGGTTTARDFPVTPGAYQSAYPEPDIDAMFAAKLTMPWATPAKTG